MLSRDLNVLDTAKNSTLAKALATFLQNMTGQRQKLRPVLECVTSAQPLSRRRLFSTPYRQSSDMPSFSIASSSILRFGCNLGLSIGDLNAELLGASNDLYPLPRRDCVCNPTNPSSQLLILSKLISPAWGALTRPHKSCCA